MDPFGSDDDDDDDPPPRAAPKKKGDGGAKKKPPPAKGGGKAAADKKPAKQAPAKAATSSSAAAGRAKPAPARAGGGGAMGAMGGSSVLKNPMSADFGDSDLSMSDMDGDIEIAGDLSHGSPGADSPVAPPPAPKLSNMDAAKRLLGEEKKPLGAPGALTKPASSVQPTVASRTQPFTSAAIPQPSKQPAPAKRAEPRADDSFERELERELGGDDPEYSMSFDTDSPARGLANKPALQPISKPPPPPQPSAAPVATTRPAQPSVTSPTGAPRGNTRMLSVDMLDDGDDPPPQPSGQQQPPRASAAPGTLGGGSAGPGNAALAAARQARPEFTPNASLPRDEPRPALATHQPQPSVPAYYQQPPPPMQPPPPLYQIAAPAAAGPAAELLNAQLQSAVARAERAEAMAAQRSQLSTSELQAQLASQAAEHEITLARAKADLQREMVSDIWASKKKPSPRRATTALAAPPLPADAFALHSCPSQLPFTAALHSCP